LKGHFRQGKDGLCSGMKTITAIQKLMVEVDVDQYVINDGRDLCEPVHTKSLLQRLSGGD
jgi:hypothetical protein